MATIAVSLIFCRLPYEGQRARGKCMIKHTTRAVTFMVGSLQIITTQAQTALIIIDYAMIPYCDGCYLLLV